MRDLYIFRARGSPAAQPLCVKWRLDACSGQTNAQSSWRRGAATETVGRWVGADSNVGNKGLTGHDPGRGFWRRAM